MKIVEPKVFIVGESVVVQEGIEEVRFDHEKV